MLSKTLKEMPQSEFLEMEKAMFSGLLECIQNVERFSQAIGDILEDFMLVSLASLLSRRIQSLICLFVGFFVKLNRRWSFARSVGLIPHD